MELTGLQIFKYLPGAKKLPEANCKKCGCPTCMAYALKLAKKQINIELCPHVSEELKEKFNEASKIQQHEIHLSDTIKTGGETVMFRHDKTFVNKTIVAVELDYTSESFDKDLKEISDYQIERIGESFKIDAVYLNGDITNINYQKAKEKIQNKNLALIENETPDYKIIKGESAEILAEKSTKETKTDKKLILELEFDKANINNTISQLTYIRRAAIQKRYEPLTYPVMVKLPQNISNLDACSIASVLVCRYANIIVLSKEQSKNKALLTTLFTLRQSIYTNPQKPLQVESKIYEFNEPNENSPILLTTNFALTYFAVAGELESLPFGSYLLVTPSDGMSVLTAWSADKFTADIVAKTVKDYNLTEKVKNRKIIIPGLLSHMKEELEEVMPKWEIIVGTIEACQIPEFFKETDN